MGSFKVISYGNDFDDNEKSEERKLNLGKNREKTQRHHNPFKLINAALAVTDVMW